ncbi:MAG: glycoside hydrolase family 16 protein, partial [Clostridiales bacterium]|nr:glycoside hydrolase family 16 protein [Clostridiales bacterium]
MFQNTAYAISGSNENHYDIPQEFTLYNLLGTSGNFEHDIDNDGLADEWNSSFVTNTAVIDNTQVFTPTRTLGGIEITVPYDTEPGDVEYVCAYIKGVPDRTFLVLNYSNNSTVNSVTEASDEFEFVSVYCLKPNKNQTKVMILTISDFSQIEIQKVVFMNLTSIFGKGNEPSKEQMDFIMQKILSAGYFISHNYSFNDIDSKHPDRLLIWEDNFDGDSLNTENWSYFTRSDGGGNKQLEYNTDREKNVRVEDHNLVITAIKENYRGRTWTSGHVTTNNLREFQYGRIEAKMKLPAGKGFWPAFWALGADLELIIVDRTTYNIGAPYPDCGEIDIMEHVNSNDYTNAAIHWEGSSGLTSRIYYTDDCIDAFDVTEYHVYAIEWTEEQILFLVDNNVFGTFNLSEADTKTGNAFRRPHYLIINLAVGGTFPGMPDKTTPDSGTMYVDWVRVYAPEGVTSYVDAE